MQPFTTDVGTLRLLATLTQAGRNMLDAFLRQCDGQRSEWHHVEPLSLGGIHFTRADVAWMKLERETKDVRAGRRRIVATTEFKTGAMWRRGSLRMPGVVLPDMMMSAIKGRLIEELVDGAPLDGYRIRHAVQDGRPDGPNGTRLRIRSDGEEQGDIPYEPRPPVRMPWHG